MFKIVGAVLVFVGCGGFGFKIAANYKKEEKTLRSLISMLDYMACELQYRLTPLPELCRQTAGQCCGCLRTVFANLAVELEDQIAPDVERCMSAVICKTKDIPIYTKEGLTLLGRSIGRYDVDLQLKSLETVRHECRQILERLTVNQETRIRSYQTLGLCAGAAMAILFI